MNIVEKAIDAIQSALNLSSKEESLDAVRNDVRRQFDAAFQPQSEVVRSDHAWVVEVFEDHAIANVGEKHFSIPFTRNEKGVVEFVDRTEWKEVTRKQEWVETGKSKAISLASTLKVTKDASGHFRWTMITSSAFKDKEDEIVSLAALKADVERTDKGADSGPLRWWHIGKPDIATRSAGPGVDIGHVDFRAVHSKSLIESGTFISKEMGEAFSKAKNLAGSIMFFHPIDQPDKEGVYHDIHSAERSFLPDGKQANLLSTQPIVKEDTDMDKEKLETLEGIIGKDAVKVFVGDVDSKEASAEDAGIASKESAGINMETLTKALTESLPGIITPIVETQVKSAVDSAMESYKAESNQSGNDTKAAEKAATEQSEQTKAMVTKLDVLTEAVTVVAKEVKELMGNQPRANGQGYRPTQDTATLINKDDIEKAGSTASPLGAFIDNMILDGNGKQ